MFDTGESVLSWSSFAFPGSVSCLFHAVRSDFVARLSHPSTWRMVESGTEFGGSLLETMEGRFEAGEWCWVSRASWLKGGEGEGRGRKGKSCSPSLRRRCCPCPCPCPRPPLLPLPFVVAMALARVIGPSDVPQQTGFARAGQEQRSSQGLANSILLTQHLSPSHPPLPISSRRKAE
jgi:hypothetical protein